MLHTKQAPRTYAVLESSISMNIVHLPHMEFLVDLGLQWSVIQCGLQAAMTLLGTFSAGESIHESTHVTETANRSEMVLLILRRWQGN